MSKVKYSYKLTQSDSIDFNDNSSYILGRSLLISGTLFTLGGQMTRKLLDFRHDISVKGQCQTKKNLVVWLVNQTSLFTVHMLQPDYIKFIWFQ